MPPASPARRRLLRASPTRPRPGERPAGRLPTPVTGLYLAAARRQLRPYPGSIRGRERCSWPPAIGRPRRRRRIRTTARLPTPGPRPGRRLGGATLPGDCRRRERRSRVQPVDRSRVCGRERPRARQRHRYVRRQGPASRCAETPGVGAAGAVGRPTRAHPSPPPPATGGGGTGVARAGASDDGRRGRGGSASADATAPARTLHPDEPSRLAG